MATLQAYGGSPASANLGTAQTGNVVSTNIIDRGVSRDGSVGPGLLRIITTVGATPTCTYLVEGSANGTEWYPAPIADPATPGTLSGATFAITSATTTFKFLAANQPWRYLRVTMSANTNVTSTLDLFTF